MTLKPELRHSPGSRRGEGPPACRPAGQHPGSRPCLGAVPAVRGEADAVHRALEVEVVEHGPAQQADQQRLPACRTRQWPARGHRRAAGPRRGSACLRRGQQGPCRVQPRRRPPDANAGGTEPGRGPGVSTRTRPRPRRGCTRRGGLCRLTAPAGPGGGLVSPGARTHPCTHVIGHHPVPPAPLPASGGYLHRR